MENQDLVRFRRSHWVFEDLIPDETTNSEGVPVKLSPLNLKQELFVREYVKNPSLPKSEYAKGLGIRPGQITSWLASPKVRRAIQLKMRDKLKTADLDANWVLNNTRDVIERCMDDANFQPGHALKGLELIGKHFEVFNDKVDIRQNTIIRIESNLPKLKFQEAELLEHSEGSDNGA